jgi:hypothetical protein
MDDDGSVRSCDARGPEVCRGAVGRRFGPSNDPTLGHTSQSGRATRGFASAIDDPRWVAACGGVAPGWRAFVASGRRRSTTHVGSRCGVWVAVRCLGRGAVFGSRCGAATGWCGDDATVLVWCRDDAGVVLVRSRRCCALLDSVPGGRSRWRAMGRACRRAREVAAWLPNRRRKRCELPRGDALDSGRLCVQTREPWRRWWILVRTGESRASR